ncbi:hypothetical protein BH10PSE17_BH10PSE17_04600 [soil metagenome]
MSDNKTLTGKADRDRVAEDEDYEVEVLAKKHGKSVEVVKRVIRGVGPMRKDIEAELSK